jgi:hypothetical protein
VQASNGLVDRGQRRVALVPGRGPLHRPQKR